MAWVALAPFLLALDERPWQERLAFGCIWGALTFGLLTRWMIDVGYGGYVIFAAILSSAPVIFSLLAVSPVRCQIFQLVWWPCAWAVSEWLRMLVMGGFAWSLAYSQAAHPSLIQLASFGGVWAVVWLMVLANGSVCLALKSRGNRRKVFILTAVIILGANWAVGWLRQRPDRSIPSTIRLALIQPNISREDKNDPLYYDKNVMRHLLLSERALSWKRPDMYIWPETAFPDDILQDFKWRPWLEALARKEQAYYLIGSALEKEGRSLNAALLLSPQGEWVDAYYKIKLVPFTEYTPPGSIAHWLAGRLGVKPYDFMAGKGLGVFSLASSWRTLDQKARRFGVVICSEDAYPDSFRQLALRQVGFIVTILNDGWFRHQEAVQMHAQNAAFRAVESGVPVVRVANTGKTAVFDPGGKSVGDDYLLADSEGFLVVDLPLAGQRTLYVLLGDIFVWLCAGFVIIALLIALYLGRSKVCQK